MYGGELSTPSQNVNSAQKWEPLIEISVVIKDTPIEIPRAVYQSRTESEVRSL